MNLTVEGSTLGEAMMTRSDIFTSDVFTSRKFTAAWFAIAFLTGVGVMVGMTTDPSQGTPRPAAKPDQLALVARTVSASAPAADGSTLTKADRLDIVARPTADTPATEAAAPAPTVTAAPAIAPAPSTHPSQPVVAARWDNANARAADMKAVAPRAVAPAAHKPAPPKPAPVATHPPAPAKPAVVAARQETHQETRQEMRPPAELRSAPKPHRVAAKPAAPRNVANTRACQPSDNPFTGLLQSLNMMQRCEG